MASRKLQFRQQLIIIVVVIFHFLVFVIIITIILIIVTFETTCCDNFNSTAVVAFSCFVCHGVCVSIMRLLIIRFGVVVCHRRIQNK